MASGDEYIITAVKIALRKLPYFDTESKLAKIKFRVTHSQGLTHLEYRLPEKFRGFKIAKVKIFEAIRDRLAKFPKAGTLSTL